MSLSLSLREITAAAVALMLFGAGALTATTAIRQPSGMHAILEVWADIARDVDSVGLAVTRVSPKEEKAVGDTIARQVEQSFASPSDAALQPYVDAVGQRLLRAMPKTPLAYSFKVVGAPEINAFALPGGHVYVTTGLLAALHSEAALAAVVGHEISHVSLGHCIERLQYELAARRIAGDDFAEIVGLAHQLFSAAYDREQETEADRNGVLLAATAGYDPRAVLDAMRLFASLETQAEQAGTVGGQILQSVGETIGDYARSHPPAEQRIADLETLIERNASTWRGKQFYLGARDYAQVVTHEPGDYQDWRVFTFDQPAAPTAPAFPYLTGHLVDQAGVIPANVRTVMNNRLASVNYETGDQFVVATITSLEGRDIRAYGYQLGQYWGIGGVDKKGKGVLLVVAPNEHQVDIEFGYGVTLSGARAQEIIQKTILPRFRSGDVAGGIEHGVDEVIRVLSGKG